jgi:hypothetical protein
VLDEEDFKRVPVQVHADCRYQRVCRSRTH